MEGAGRVGRAGSASRQRTKCRSVLCHAWSMHVALQTIITIYNAIRENYNYRCPAIYIYIAHVLLYIYIYLFSSIVLIIINVALQIKSSALQPSANAIHSIYKSTRPTRLKRVECQRCQPLHNPMLLWIGKYASKFTWRTTTHNTWYYIVQISVKIYPRK